MINRTIELCKEHGVELLYLVKFGSHLYGTNTPSSDTDYKGIFLPSLKQCVLGKAPRHITTSTGDNGSRNTEDDVDIQLWSLQYFLDLVSRGETNALDLLFSYTNKEAVNYVHHSFVMDMIFGSVSSLFNIKDCNAYIGYAIGQAAKYGIKGSRLGVIKNVNAFIKANVDENNGPIHSLIKAIDEKYHDASYCFIKNINGVDSIVLCGKVHQGSIKYSEFSERVEREYKRYGARSELAEKNEGVDWKALSHAMRSLVQMKMLIDDGCIKYPLYCADKLLDIKLGKLSYDEVSAMISNDIEEVKVLIAGITKPGFVRDDSVIKNIILFAYDMTA